MNEEKYILFDQYLQGELSKEAYLDFEKQLAENSELQSEFETFKEVQLQLATKFDSAVDRETFETNLKKISNEYFKSKKAKVIRLQSWMYMMAASVVFVLGLFLFRPTKPSFEEYNHYENAYLTERGSGLENLKEAEEAFNTKNYKVAILLFEAILKENQSAEIRYFYGVSLLEDNQIKEAETIFKAIQSGNSIYKNKAIWSLALAKLKQKDYQSCENLLKKIPSDYENYDKVEELLDKLE